MMRIVLVSPLLAPEFVVGVELYVERIKFEFARRGFELFFGFEDL